MEIFAQVLKIVNKWGYLKFPKALLSKHNDNAMHASYISLLVTKSEGGKKTFKAGQ